MAYDYEAGRGGEGRPYPTGDRYYGPAEWAGQGGSADRFERLYLGGDATGQWRAPWSGTRRGSAAGRGPRDYRRSDESIADAVYDALWRDHALDAEAIEFDVRDGTVSLRGEVETWNDRRRAEQVLADIGGVRQIDNALRVRRR